jgi:hypothetical protein
LEWERHVLRANLKAFPDRLDLLRRLAVVELSTQEHTPLDVALEFELRLLQLQNVSLLGQSSSDEHRLTRRRAIELAVSVLSSPVLLERSCHDATQIIQQIHDSFMSSPGEDLAVVAEAGLQTFTLLLQEPGLTLQEACCWYDCLHSMFFAFISDVRELVRFDRIAVPLFEQWLMARAGQQPPEAFPSMETLSIAYLIHIAHFERGNAVSPLVCSLVEAHSKFPQRKIYLYAVEYCSQEFLDSMADRGVAVRTFPVQNRYDQLEPIERQLKADSIDVIVTEQNRSIATYLYVRRSAPCQIWLDTGFVFWRLQNLDWTLTPIAKESVNKVLKTSLIRFGQNQSTLVKSNDLEEVASLRSAFPPGCFLIGVISRLIKIDRSYLGFLQRLVQADERFHVLLAGPGDASLIEDFISSSGLGDRMSLIKGMVDLRLYGSIIDVLCDTFPFIGGLACREVAIHGTPVVSKLGTPWDAMLRLERNSELLANSVDELVSIVVRLASDSSFMMSQRSQTLHKVMEYQDPASTADDVERAILECKHSAMI